ATLDINGRLTQITKLSGNGTITNSSGATGVTTFNRGASPDSTFAGSIQDGASGPGGMRLRVLGTGTRTLTRANSYTCSATVESNINFGTPTLQVGNGGTSGSIVGNVAFVNGVGTPTLAFNRSDNLTYGGNLSGTGALIQKGAGTLTLSGDNSGFTGTMTINAGTLAVSADNNLGFS